MLIRNNTDYSIILNIRNRENLVNVPSLENYSLDGIIIPAKSKILQNVSKKNVLYFANLPLNKACYISLLGGIHDINLEKTKNINDEIIDIWDSESDIMKCHHSQYCKDSINLVMKFKLHEHIIWEIYNSVSYSIIALIFTLILIIVIFLIIKFIKCV